MGKRGEGLRMWDGVFGGLEGYWFDVRKEKGNDYMVDNEEEESGFLKWD